MSAVNVHAVDADTQPLDAPLAVVDTTPKWLAEWRAHRQGPWPTGDYRRESDAAIDADRDESPQETYDREHEMPDGWDMR